MADPSIAVPLPEEATSQYIPYPLLLAADFQPSLHANHLLHATTAPTDPPPLDLAPALSRALFDAQEIDTHLDAVTTTRAAALVAYTAAHRDASRRVLADVEQQIRGLDASYARLRRDVADRWLAADATRRAAERLSATLRLGRDVQRVVALGRRLDAAVVAGTGTGTGTGTENPVMVARTVLEVRRCLAEGAGTGLTRVRAVTAVTTEVSGPAERWVLGRAQAAVREFALSGLVASSTSASATSASTSTIPGMASGTTGGQGGGAGGSGEKTFAQAEEAKARTTAALQTLYLLSPVKIDATTPRNFEPTLLLQALQAYLQTALSSSLASLSRALATLPTLDRTLLEISARCQNIVALEALLESTRPPAHPLLLPSPSAKGTGAGTEVLEGEEDERTEDNLLRPLLRHLDTSSLPSYFWRSMAGQLASRVQEILNRGGVSARTLRSNRDRVRDAVRECVDRGSRLPSVAGGRRESKGNWEREAAVMVGSVMGVLGR